MKYSYFINELLALSIILTCLLEYASLLEAVEVIALEVQVFFKMYIFLLFLVDIWILLL